MSMSFEVFPTNKIVPKCSEIIESSVYLFSEFMHGEKRICDMRVTAREVSPVNVIYKIPLNLVSKQGNYTVFDVNKEGEIYVFYHSITEIDKEFWHTELQYNKNAQALREKINDNLDIGYYWSIKRTMSQPLIVNLYYGYLAIALAVLTDGIIYSDDGAWDYSLLPIEGATFKDIYLNTDKIHT